MKMPHKQSNQELLSHAYRVLAESKRIIAQKRALLEEARAIAALSFKAPCPPGST